MKEIIKKDSDMITTEVYYCTKKGNVKGLLKLKDNLITFDPLKCLENNEFLKLDEFQCMIDIEDISTIDIVKLQNESV